MSFFWNGAVEAWHLIVTRNQYLVHTLWVTLKVAGVSTFFAGIVGIPLGLVLGVGRFRGRSIGLVLANAGLALPPVAVGGILSLLMFPDAPLGRFHLLYTLRGVYVAQTILAFPVLVALTAAAVGLIAPGLLDQARAYDANWMQVAVLALREARVGVLAAIIVAVGSALSEVGAVILVGGNIYDYDDTLASAAVEQISSGRYSLGMALVFILLGLIVIVAALLTFLQYRGARAPYRLNRSS